MLGQEGVSCCYLAFREAIPAVSCFRAASATMEYNLDELDANLSAGTNGMDSHDGSTGNTRSGGVARTNTRRGSVVTMPGTRRGSLKGRDDAFSRAGLAMQRHAQYNLFHFELRELAKQLLLQRGETCASYHEYAVYAPPDHDKDGDYRTPSLIASDAEGLQMLRNALRHGYGLNEQVCTLYTGSQWDSTGGRTIFVSRCGCACRLTEPPRRAHLSPSPPESPVY